MRAYLALAVGFAILLVDGYDLQSVSFVLPELARSWQLQTLAFGPVFAAGLAGTIPGAMLAGPLARVLGHRRALAGALLVFGVGSWSTGQVAGITPLLPIRFIVGLGLGACVPLVMTAVAREVPHRLRATLVTLTLCGQPLGAMLGAAACARLIPAFGWQAVFLLGGTLPLLLLPGLLVFRGTPPSALAPSAPRDERSNGRVMQLFASNRLSMTLALWMSTFLAAFVVYVVVNWLPALVRHAGHSLQDSMVALALFNFGGVVGAVVIGWLADRWSPVRATASAFGLAALVLLIQSFSHESLPVFLTACALTGMLGYGGAISLGPLAVLQYPAELATTGTGWALAMGRLGGALSPLVVTATLASGTSEMDLFMLAAGGAVLTALCLCILAGLSKPRQLPAAHATRDAR